MGLETPFCQHSLMYVSKYEWWNPNLNVTTCELEHLQVTSPIQEKLDLLGGQNHCRENMVVGQSQLVKKNKAFQDPLGHPKATNRGGAYWCWSYSLNKEGGSQCWIQLDMPDIVGVCCQLANISLSRVDTFMLGSLIVNTGISHTKGM